MTLTDCHIEGKNWIQQVLVGLSSSFPINYTCYQYTAVGKYWTLCVQIVWLLNGANWHETPWKLGLFTFWLWSWHCIQLALTITAMIQIYILGARLKSFKKQNIFQCHILNNSPIRPSKSLLKSPSGEGNHSLPGLTWFERPNLIGWFFLSKEISLADTEYLVK